MAEKEDEGKLLLVSGGRRGPAVVSRLPCFSTNERKGSTHSSNSPENSALLGKVAGLYRKGHGVIVVLFLFYGAVGYWLSAGIGRGARGDWASGGAGGN